MRVSNIPKIPSGIPGFDELLNGGFPRGRATLISGRSGTGKTVLTLQAACEFARSGERALFVTTEEAASDLLSLGDALGWGASKLAGTQALRVVDFVPDFGSPVVVSGQFDLQGFALRITKEAEAQGARVIVVDSLSALLAPLPDAAPRRHLFAQLVSAFLRTGRTVILTNDSREDYGPATAYAMEDFVCDTIVILRNIVDGKRRRRSIEVQKYRRSSHLKGEYPCAITAEGVRIFPLDAAPRDANAEATRFPSGIAGLDAMTGGGWLRDAIVLVRGPTGSGKTILAGMYACAGAARGERVFYYGFEESEGLLLRNFDLLGIPVRRHVESGNLKLVARFPEATSPEDMIIELRGVLEEHSPSLIVLDSISAIEHVTSYESFRQFVVGLTSALRQHGRSALLTHSVPNETSVDKTAPYMSTLADAILLVGYELAANGMNRYIRVLKMRGSAHSDTPHSLRIMAGGLAVNADPLQ